MAPGRRLGGALANMQYGHRFYNESYSTDGIRVVRITDLSESGDLDFSAMPRMAVTQDERAKYALSAGEVIFARSGATVGKVALVREGEPECIAGAYFISMRFSAEVEPEYARALLASTSIRLVIAKQSRQAAQQNFSGPALKRLPMPIPPLEQQRRFAQVVASGRRFRATVRSNARELDALFASLQQRAFSGQL
jgi:type I restriction enzyme S subunit